MSSKSAHCTGSLQTVLQLELKQGATTSHIVREERKHELLGLEDHTQVSVQKLCQPDSVEGCEATSGASGMHTSAFWAAAASRRSACPVEISKCASPVSIGLGQTGDSSTLSSVGSS